VPADTPRPRGSARGLQQTVSFCSASARTVATTTDRNRFVGDRCARAQNCAASKHQLQFSGRRLLNRYLLDRQNCGLQRLGHVDPPHRHPRLGACSPGEPLKRHHASLNDRPTSRTSLPASALALRTRNSATRGTGVPDGWRHSRHLMNNTSTCPARRHITTLVRTPTRIRRQCQNRQCWNVLPAVKGPVQHLRGPALVPALSRPGHTQVACPCRPAPPLSRTPPTTCGARRLLPNANLNCNSAPVLLYRALERIPYHSHGPDSTPSGPY
jgi:hypothetical protein